MKGSIFVPAQGGFVLVCWPQRALEGRVDRSHFSDLCHVSRKAQSGHFDSFLKHVAISGSALSFS